MATKYSDDELRILNEKAEHPDKTVLCPRCGKELIFKDYGCGYEVFCPTKGCLKDTVRGI